MDDRKKIPAAPKAEDAEATKAEDAQAEEPARPRGLLRTLNVLGVLVGILCGIATFVSDYVHGRTEKLLISAGVTVAAVLAIVAINYWGRRIFRLAVLKFVAILVLVLLNFAAWGIIAYRLWPTGPVTVKVAAGSEDLAFFSDSAVKAEFARQGLDVRVTGFGSVQLATYVNLSEYDAIFPSSTVTAAEVQQKLGGQANDVTEIVPFGTPLVVFTWKQLIPLLRTLKIVTQSGTFDVGQYLAVLRAGTGWNSISGNTFYPNPNQVQLEMTDPRYSNSGAMFVAAASYALNGDRVVSKSQVKPVGAKLAQALGGAGWAS